SLVDRWRPHDLALSSGPGGNDPGSSVRGTQDLRSRRGRAQLLGTAAVEGRTGVLPGFCDVRVGAAVVGDAVAGADPAVVLAGARVVADGSADVVGDPVAALVGAA